MITYRYKLYQTDKTKHLDRMFREACFVWNHALALQKRYYRLYGKYIDLWILRKHFSKRINRITLHSQTSQDILERLDIAYRRFFKRIAKRPPKFRKEKFFSSIVFKQNGFSLNGNVLKINRINKKYKFSLSRPYNGKIKTIYIKRNKIGEYFISIVVDEPVQTYEKTHNGASVGIDFGLKTYLTLNTGETFENPLFMKKELKNLRILNHKYSLSKERSNNKERNHKYFVKKWDDILNRRNDFQWKLAHILCKKYDIIFIEDLDLISMKLYKNAKRKLIDLSHASFIKKLEYIALKYNVKVHKIERYYPSSQTCPCGYINKELKITDRKWKCPQCGTEHDRDLLAANNILRRGIYELESDYKSSKHSAKRLSHYNPTITRLTT